jgi:NADPH:quinone reductase-like Zn-dependent oxidoreductase
MVEQQFAKQVVISRRGGPRVLKVEQVTPQDVGDHQVRVRVSTAGVAYADILMREGLYPDAPSTPFVPGYDVVGTIDAVGSQVTNLRPGQRVAVLCQVGGYSESLITDSWLAIPVPEAVGDAEGVALILNYMTAYQMLRRMARVEPGERILVHGAAGGVGTALLQLAAWMKLDVWGTASAGKHPVLIEHGATPIDYRSQDFVEVIRNHTGDGVDAVFDAVGGKNWQRSLQTLRAGGRLVGYGFSAAMKNGRRRLGRAAIAWLAAPRTSALANRAENPPDFAGDPLGDPNDTKLELGCGVLEGLGGAPDARGLRSRGSGADPDVGARRLDRYPQLA